MNEEFYAVSYNAVNEQPTFIEAWFPELHEARNYVKSSAISPDDWMNFHIYKVTMVRRGKMPKSLLD